MIIKLFTKYTPTLLLLISFIGLASINIQNVEAQTDGTLTFTFTEAVSGPTKNVMAVWIEDNSGVFVKTKMRFWGPKTKDHLPAWVSSSGQNVIDATTGATLSSSTNPTAFGVKTVTWDGKDVLNTTVPDGTYKLFIETAWANPEPNDNQHSDIINFTFEKTTGSTHVTPGGNSNFSDITIDWAPALSAIDSKIENLNKFISVYPNPSNGLIFINFKKSSPVSRILIENINSQVVYQEKINGYLNEVKSLNLQQLNNGIYIIEILFTDNSKSFRSKISITK